ncbi:MAG: integration host factor subunit beta [Spirochaetaceae bacterium]|nr:integration host factor subunit beta [Spirochaetaceae bacterium]
MGRDGKLTKAEIIEMIHPEVDISKKHIHQVLGLFFDAVKAGLFDRQTIELRGFGTFEIRVRKGRKARNPKTGAAVEVGDHGVVAFRPGQELKKRAWQIRE